MSNHPQIKYVVNNSELGEAPLHFIANEDKEREIEVRSGALVNYNKTGFPWVSNTNEIAENAIVVSQSDVELMWLFKGYSDNKIYYNTVCDWDSRKELKEPGTGSDRHFYFDVSIKAGVISAPTLKRYNPDDKLPIKYLRVLFIAADDVNLTSANIKAKIEWSNTTLTNSHVPFRLESAGQFSAQYKSTDNLDTDLGNMRLNAEFFKHINKLRGRYLADAVALVIPVGSNTGMGLAFTNSYGTAYPFTAMRESMFNTSNKWLLLHELSHIMGVRHASGYLTSSFRTIMNKNFETPVIAHLSNPNSYHPAPYKNKGEATGTATHDSAGVLISKARSISKAAVTMIKEESEPIMTEMVPAS